MRVIYSINGNFLWETHTYKDAPCSALPNTGDFVHLPQGVVLFGMNHTPRTPDIPPITFRVLAREWRFKDCNHPDGPVPTVTVHLRRLHHPMEEQAMHEPTGYKYLAAPPEFWNYVKGVSHD